VFAGASLASILTSGLAVILGEAVIRGVPAAWIRAAGVAFVVMGILCLLGKE
jgi:putative Ca2+/H+ antiporter (TMEM165/GDT1 family)